MAKRAAVIDLKKAIGAALRVREFRLLLEEAMGTKKGTKSVQDQMVRITAKGTDRQFKGLAAFLKYSDFLETEKLKQLVSGSNILEMYEQRVARDATKTEKRAAKKRQDSMEILKNVAQLVDVIGAGCSPDAQGPVVAEYRLWNGKIVRASYYKGRKRPDAVFSVNVVIDDERLQPLAAKLLGGKSFVIETGTDDLVCRLEWTIK